MVKIRRKGTGITVDGERQSFEQVISKKKNQFKGKILGGKLKGKKFTVSLKGKIKLVR